MTDTIGWVTTTVETSRNGMRYITCEWVGGDFCHVSVELIREGSPYIRGRLFDTWFYIGPYKLRVIRWNDNLSYFICYRDPNSIHNRLMPKIYPLYVRWVEFWNWFIRGWDGR